jgi:hypothetical protein
LNYKKLKKNEGMIEKQKIESFESSSNLNIMSCPNKKYFSYSHRKNVVIDNKAQVVYFRGVVCLF